MDRSYRGMAVGTARFDRTSLSPGRQNRLRELRCKPHDMCVLRCEIAGYRAGDCRWRLFHGSDRRAAQGRHKLRIVPA